MRPEPNRPQRVAGQISLAVMVALATADVASAAYEAPNPAYLAPAGYYASATDTGALLKQELYTITSTGFTYRSYGDSRYTLNQLWADPSNPNNVLLIYNGASVSGTWDNGVTWNREHQFTENSLGISVSNSYKGYGSDLFELAPSNPSVNESRSNLGYGYTGTTSTPKFGTYGQVMGNGSTYWFPSTADEGDVARSVFYMVTRYGQGQGVAGTPDATNKYNLTVANGLPNTTGQTGDLNSLLHWAYEDPIDNFERRKNSMIYSGLTAVINGSVANESQGNRNPYIDHPEYIWAVFGTGASDSQIYVGNSAASDGSSSANVNLGRVIVNAPLGTANVAINKAGVDPTTYDVNTAGDAVTPSTGAGQTFDYNPQSHSIQVGLSSSTATAGLKSGSISIDNTDLTSQGAGTGAADGNDTINVSGTVLNHSKASFSSSGPSTNISLNFGAVAQGTGTASLPFGISNFETLAGFTAGLNLNSIVGSGDTGVLSTDLAPFMTLAGGSTNTFTASLDSSSLGTYTATYRLSAGDENLPGATQDQSLTLTLTGDVLQRQWYANADGTWSTASNWLGPVPMAAGDTANFLNVITAPRTVTLDGPQTAAHVLFDSAFQYTIAGSATLTISNGAALADVDVNQGTHSIAAPLAIASDTTVNIAAAAGLGIDGAFSIGSGKTLTKNGTGVLTISGPQSHGSSSTFVASGGITSFNSDPGFNLSVTANSTVNFEPTVGPGISCRHLGALSIQSAGQVTVVASVSSISRTVLVTSALNFAGSTGAWQGSLDLTNNDLIVRNGDPVTIVNQLKQGYGSGLWNGAGGITSSTAVAASSPKTALGYGSMTGIFDGESVTNSDIVLKYTLVGDTNLDSTVNFTDLLTVAQHYSGTNTTWATGDFTYDGTTNFTDLLGLAQNYSKVLSLDASQISQLNAAGGSRFASALAQAETQAAVPEPSEIGAALVGIAGLGRRRNKAGGNKKPVG